MLKRAKSSILLNGNFREFFLWWGGGILRFQNGNSRWPCSKGLTYVGSSYLYIRYFSREYWSQSRTPLKRIVTFVNITSSSAIAKRPSCGEISYGQEWKLELGDYIYGQYRSIFNHCDVFGQQRNRNRRGKRKIRAITPSRSSRSVPIESPYATSY